MRKMEEFSCDTYCGLNCGACDVMIAYKTGNKSAFASFWTEPNLEAFLKSKGVNFEKNDLKLQCHGCKSDDVFIYCKSCEIRECAINKNVEHCSDCDEYPCEIFSNWKKLQVFLPHIKSQQGNLDAINEIGVDRWIEDQEKQWKCPQCNTSFSWYADKCNSCGADLTEYSFKFSKLKSLVMQIGFRLSSIEK
jgi:hypothetical protein